jgi:hypothetical protein
MPLSLARRLRERAGFTPEHAEEAAQAIAETIGDRVATREDVNAATAALRSEMAELRSEMSSRIAEVRADLTRFILTVASGQAAVLLAAMFSIARFSR